MAVYVSTSPRSPSTSQRWKWNPLNATTDHTADWFYYYEYGMLVSELLTRVEKGGRWYLSLFHVWLTRVSKKVYIKDSCWLFQWRCSNCNLYPPIPPCLCWAHLRCVYSQCASTTSRGTVSSGKLTARRVREAVSSSSSSSLSRSAALWPMAAHRRHFLFHSSGDVTWKHTKYTLLLLDMWYILVIFNLPLQTVVLWSKSYPLFKLRTVDFRSEVFLSTSIPTTLVKYKHKAHILPSQAYWWLSSQW